MNTTHLARVRRLFPAADQGMPLPPSAVRHNRRAWVRSVRLLGDKWRLSQEQHVPRQEALQ